MLCNSGHFGFVLYFVHCGCTLYMLFFKHFCWIHIIKKQGIDQPRRYRVKVNLPRLLKKSQVCGKGILRRITLFRLFKCGQKKRVAFDLEQNDLTALFWEQECISDDTKSTLSNKQIFKNNINFVIVEIFAEVWMIFLRLSENWV